MRERVRVLISICREARKAFSGNTASRTKKLSRHMKACSSAKKKTSISGVSIFIHPLDSESKQDLFVSFIANRQHFKLDSEGGKSKIKLLFSALSCTLSATTKDHRLRRRQRLVIMEAGGPGPFRQSCSAPMG